MTPTSPPALVPDPPLPAAAALMQATWERPCWRYDTTVLRHYLERPSHRAPSPSGAAPLHPSLGAMRGGALVGFFAGVPIDVSWQGRVHPAIFTSFLSVDRAVQDPTLAIRLVRRVLEDARAAGRLHVYTVFFEATGTLDAVQRMLQLAGCPMTVLHDIRFLLCPAALVAPTIDPGAGAGAAVDERLVPYAADWRAQTHALLTRTSARLPLTQLVPESDLDSVLTDSQAVTTRLWQTGGRVRGLVTARLRELLHERTRTNLHLDLIVTDDMSDDEQDLFLRRALAAIAEPHIDALVVPDTGAVPAAVLRRLGFVETPQRAQLAVGYLDADALRVGPTERSWFEVY